MERATTRGHDAALAAVGAMVRGPRPTPHAVLLSGPGGVGKTTLALDLAAGLLCTTDDRNERPCRTCRGCRLVASGGHPDLHRLAPDGPGSQIVIGGREAKVRGIRNLVEDLAMMPMEGGARVALITAAHRMNEDAQAALLKTLEEPPAGVTIMLCADHEDRLLPTVRSRCARIRLGRVSVRHVEEILLTLDVPDVALAGRLARISDGRPGVALAYARSPEAVRARGELARGFLDLLEASPSARLAAIKAAAPTAIAMMDALDGGAVARGPTRVGGRSVAVAEDQPEDDEDMDASPTRAVSAARRRRAAEALIGVWMDVTRDLALVAAGGKGSVRDLALLDESAAAVDRLEPGALAAFLLRLVRAAELVAGNVSPELVLDSLVLGWPVSRAA